MGLDNTVVITFCGEEHEFLRQEFHNQYDIYFGESEAYTTEWLKQTSFYKDNMQVFKYKKYFGYFLWKPYIILDAMMKFPNLNVLYCDSNLRFTDFLEFEKAYNRLMKEQDAFFIEHQNFINKDWTKRDCFVLMDADRELYHSSKQVWTPLIGIRPTAMTFDLMDNYLGYCTNPSIVTEEPNKHGENLEGFIEHRWEQSVLSILTKRYGYTGVSDTEAVNWVRKLYPEEIVRLRKEENKDVLAIRDLSD